MVYLRVSVHDGQPSAFDDIRDLREEYCGQRVRVV